MDCEGDDDDGVLVFFINGQEIRDPQPNPETTLLYYLRRKLNLTGSKLGCGEGGCGACTVMVSKYDKQKDYVRHYTVNACLTLVCSVHGMAVTTVEGIGSIKEGLHPCQERIAKAHGSQCGFCTPGFVMSMYTLLRNNPTPSQRDIEETIEGNLCRCTGYRAILDGYKTFCPCGKDGGTCCNSQLFDQEEFIPFPSNKERDYIFPPKLKEAPPPPLNITGGRVSWYQPTDLHELVKLRDKYPLLSGKGDPQYRLVVGATRIGSEIKSNRFYYPVLINSLSVPELSHMEDRKGGLLVGMGLSVSLLERKLKHIIGNLPSHRIRVFQAFVEMLRWFAGPQLKNVACIGGNIATASPISDLLPILIACRVEVTAASVAADGSVSQRSFPMDDSFITGYRTISLEPNEVLVSVILPYTTEGEYVCVYKQSRRRKKDIAIVNSCFRVVLDKQQVVEQCYLVFGGMSYKTVAAIKTERALIGRKWDSDILSVGLSSLADEMVVKPDAPGGMPDYRLCLALSFFYKFYLSITNQLTGISPNELSATEFFKRPVSKSVQGFQRGMAEKEPVGHPMMNVSSLKQASGEAKYVDDLPHFENELYAGLVLSSKAHAEFTLDTSPLQTMEGVVDIVTAKDVPGSNITGIGNDEEVFADGVVKTVGQIIAIVLAKDKPTAQRAAQSVVVKYGPDLPAIISIEDARKAEKFLPVVRRITRGDAESELSKSHHVCKGSMRTCSQVHFYLETNACLAIPKGEEGEMEIIASTQLLDGIQMFVAKALGVLANRIVCKVKRVGGGFGGKQSRSLILSTAVAVAANKVGVPVRIMLDRNEDIMYSGMRHPFLGEYEAGFTEDGLLTSYDLNLFSNTGYSIDVGIAVMERGMMHSFNTYSVPSARIVGRVCLTNIPSNTAFRGLGAPQAMMVMEDLMDRAAYQMNIDPAELRYKNLLRNGDILPYGVELEDCHMTRCWESLLKTSNYEQRKKDIEQFNKNNNWTKRGVALIPTMYGIALGLKELNQGGALVHVYKDGSVLLTHGGIEIGQGLHTKMIQVCSRCFDIPTDKIFISETSSDKVANPSVTGGSTSSDLYGAAIQNACEQILKNLKHCREKYPDDPWDVLIPKAYAESVNLTAHGHYLTPDIGYDWESGRGRPYNYYCFGAGCSEVEVDTLTGGFKILRTDLLMDVGDSLNPAIDIGQVEGAFTQGLGLFTLEEVLYLKDGRLLTNGPGNYKIPSCSDIPIELNVSLMDRTPNPRAIFSSKAVGEPPLFLAASVFFAIKDAIRSARIDRGHSAVFDLIAPATSERIRMACEDQFTELAKGKLNERFDNPSDRWNVIP